MITIFGINVYVNAFIRWSVHSNTETTKLIVNIVQKITSHAFYKEDKVLNLLVL